MAAWIDKSGKPARAFFNTSGMKYRELKLKDRIPAMSSEEMIAVLATDGMLVKRPVLVLEDQVLVGYRQGDYDKLQAWSQVS